MAAEVATGAERAGARERERLAEPLVPGAAGPERRGVEREAGEVRPGVHQARPADSSSAGSLSAQSAKPVIAVGP